MSNNYIASMTAESKHPVSAELLKRRNDISHEGLDYIAMVTDPFANQNLKAVGAPDATGGNSIVFCIREEVTITRPTAVAAGNNWDAHIAFLPHQNGHSASLYNASVDFNGRRYAPTTGYAGATHLGNCLVIHSVAEGAQTFISTVQTEYESLNIEAFASGAPRSRVRLLGGGFKVQNTTAEIYKQGSVTGYCTENSGEWGIYRDGVVGGVPANPAETSWLGKTMNLPPSSLASAKQLNSKTYEAADGALCVFRPDSMDNEPKPLAPSEIMLIGRSDGQVNPDGDQLFHCTNSVVHPWTGGDAQGHPYIQFPFMQSGAYFTGLSSDSSLTVSLRLFIEVFPAPNDDLQALCTRAPAQNVAALEVADRLLSHMAPVYPASHNSFGSFTKGLLAAVRAVIPVARPLVRELGGSTASRVLDVVDAATKPNSKKKKKKK